MREEREVALFKATIRTPTERNYDGTEEPVALWKEIATWIALRRARRLREKVIARSREEIEAWRRAAGIHTRW